MGTGMVTGMEREWNENGSRKGIRNGKVTGMSYQTFYCDFDPLVRVCPKTYTYPVSTTATFKNFRNVKWAHC
jgi:hypothetical protein